MTTTQHQIQLENKLNSLIAKREEKLIELKKIKKAFVDDNPKKNKWLVDMASDIEKLDTYITQHTNRIDGMKQRAKNADQSVNRKIDTKRKILMGAYFENLLKSGELDPSYKEKFLNFVKRESDKSLFEDL
jgi:predicted  nucleic acid-binding Zn-ribbon protein